MNILIVDDEPLARQRLKHMLHELDPGCTVQEAGNGREALQAVSRAPADIALLDIRMPGMDGLELAAHLGRLEQTPAIVFTTAYDQHALAAFEARAVDYLLKPVRSERLQDALQKAARYRGTDIDALREQTQHVRSHISATMRGSLMLVPVDEVRFFLAEHKYVTVGHPQHRLLIEESLKSLETEFDNRFIRIHRNALIATRFATEINRDAEGHHYVHLDGVEEKLEVSRRLAAGVKKLLRQK